MNNGANASSREASLVAERQLQVRYFRRALWMPSIVALISWALFAVLLGLDKVIALRVGPLNDVAGLLALVSLWGMPAYLPFALVADWVLRRTADHRIGWILLWIGPTIVAATLALGLWLPGAITGSAAPADTLALYVGFALVIGYFVASVIGVIGHFRLRGASVRRSSAR